MKLVKIWQKLGKQPLSITQKTDAKVYIDGKEFYITDIKYKNGKPLGFNAIKKDMPDQGCKWAPNAQTIAIKEAINTLEKLPQVISDLKYYLDTNEERGVVYIPEFVVAKIIESLN